VIRPNQYSNRLAATVLVAVLIALAAAGCAVSTKTKVKPSEIRVAKDAAEGELLAAYNRTAGAITSLNATVEMVPTAGSAYSGVIEQYHQVNGFILAQRPGDIRVIGQAPVLSKNVFDMTSDGKTFRIYIPSKNQFITGPANIARETKKPIENLRPQHLVDALLWPEIGADTRTLFEEFDDTSSAGAARYYIVTILRVGAKPAIDRKLWFDRVDLNLARIEVFGDAGRVLSDIHLSDWQAVSTTVAAPATEGATAPSAPVASAESAGTQYPRHILIHRSHDDYQLEIRITKLAINEKISADRFELKQPAGAQLVELDEHGETKH
jgi:outer membrane lipoprotein-sorting protein